jgi:hypothetical protein
MNGADSKQVYSAWTMQPCSVYSLSNESLAKLLNEYPPAAAELQQAFAVVFSKQQKSQELQVAKVKIRSLSESVKKLNIQARPRLLRMARRQFTNGSKGNSHDSNDSGEGKLPIQVVSAVKTPTRLETAKSNVAELFKKKKVPEFHHRMSLNDSFVELFERHPVVAFSSLKKGGGGEDQRPRSGSHDSKAIVTKRMRKRSDSFPVMTKHPLHKMKC